MKSYSINQTELNRTEPNRKSRNCSLCAYVQQRVEHVDIWTAFVFFLFLVCFFYFNHSFFYSSTLWDTQTHKHPHSLLFILVYIFFFFFPISHYVRTHFRSFVRLVFVSFLFMQHPIIAFVKSHSALSRYIGCCWSTFYSIASSEPYYILLRWFSLSLSHSITHTITHSQAHESSRDDETLNPEKDWPRIYNVK